MQRGKNLIILALILTTSVLFASASQIHVDVGLNHFYKNRYLEAYREFKKAIEIDKRNPAAHYNLARVYKKQGFIKEAIVELQIAIKLDENYLAAKRELASIKASLETDVRKKLKLEGQNNLSNIDLTGVSAVEAETQGRKLLRRGRLTEASRAFELALKMKGEDANLSKLIGYIKFKQNKYSESINYYNRAKTASALDPEIYYALGLSYMKLESFDKAIENFKSAVRLDSTMIKAIFALGEAYEAKGKLEEAIFQFKLCLKQNPKLVEAQNKLTYLVGKMSYNYYSRGSYYYQQGNYEEAEPLLKLANDYGNLTDKQKLQIRDMLTTCQYWISKKQKENKLHSERKEVRQSSYVNKTITPHDVSLNCKAYLNQPVQWEGKIRFVDWKKGNGFLFVNSAPETINSDFNMDYVFGVIFPKKPEKDPRINEEAYVTVKGKIVRVEKVFNEKSSSFSIRRQPIIEATEVSFTRDNYPEPLVLRFY